MVARLLGKKLGMTRIYDDKGVVTPVTVIQAGPCTVMQVKTTETDGYNAVQLGFEQVKRSRRKKPQIGHAKKAHTDCKVFIREVCLDATPEQQVGDELTVDLFQEIKFVDVIGTTKGKGFAGVVKRHGFKGQPASHGVERKHRSPGSIGVVSGNTGRSIKKGKKMGGHMGHVRRTTRNHVVVGLDQENNLILVKGPIPGPRNGYVVVSQAKTKS
jgi:large subunit ribosomal protein L3